MEKIKYVHRQDCGFKLSAGNSGETSLNLSTEIFDLIAKGSMQLGEEKDVTFKIYKEDCIKAICFIILKLPLYQSSSNSSTKIEDGISIFQKLIDKVNSIFGDKECVDYTVNLYYRTDGRIYLNRLKVDGFSIRDVLVENNSALLFKEESDGQIAIRIISDIKDGEDVEDNLAEQQSSNLLLFQFDDATKFVWECIKLFNKNKELKQLLSSDYRSNGGSAGNYLRINGCFVAQLGQIDIEGFESIYTDEEGYINNGFDARDVDKFAIAINDVFAGRYKVVIEGNNFKLFKIVALDEPRQQIFFGAPGTGKSYRVEQITEQYGDDVIRTTFHPDSDYSTFVGCYKPTMQELQGELTDQPILDYDSLVDKFKEYLNVPNANITKACTLFGYHYHNSIVRMQEQGRRITDLVNDAYKSNTSYDSVVRGGMACYEEERYIPASKTEIAYSFVPQAFTQAYTRAWLNPSRPIFLIIEELNRGNCAQIFGDIFQLLDRNDKNESAYSIIPDNDLQKHLADQFKDADNIPADIQSGLKMRLPSNLYIWATMNTSDQSLFPIDSAFKRRWIWKYIPIANAELDYKIQVGDNQYDWWSFVEKVNNEIEGATKSEDKKLGYFFAKAENGIIPAETFVSKVVFYLWNDVFKDSYDKTIFKDGLTFHRFFEPNGDPKLEIIDTFLHDLDLKAIGEE